MRITQGTFSFLPDLTDEQITKQLDYCLNNGWAVGIEYTDDPHPRNTAGILLEINSARKTFPNHYIRVTAFDATHTVESVVMSFIVNRPDDEPGFRLVRQEDESRRIRYSIESYAVQSRPEGQRY